MTPREKLLPTRDFPIPAGSMRKPKPFKKTTEVKRQARLRVGSPPAAQTHQDKRKKPPKHKEREELVDGMR